MFGTTQLYVFCNPKQRDSSKEKFPDVTFESAQEEITSHSGFDLNNENKSRGLYVIRFSLGEWFECVCVCVCAVADLWGSGPHPHL